MERRLPMTTDPPARLPPLPRRRGGRAVTPPYIVRATGPGEADVVDRTTGGRSAWRDWLLGAKVRVLRLRPGDVVVLETAEPLSRERAEAVKRQWAERFPDIDLAVLSKGLHARAVVRREDAT